MDELTFKAVSRVVLREELEDRFLLFDPDTGVTARLGCTGALIWRLLDGERRIDEIVDRIRQEYEDAPVDVHLDVTTFVDSLLKKGLVDQVGSGG